MPSLERRLVLAHNGAATLQDINTVSGTVEQNLLGTVKSRMKEDDLQ
jgi:hypothetical protein